MVLSLVNKNRLSNWRTPLALSGLLATAVGFSAGACGAPPPSGDGTSGSGSGTTATNGSGSGSSGTTNDSGSATTDATGIEVTTLGSSGDGDGDTTDGPMGVDGEFCSDFQIEFEPQVPTVFVIVDRSTSMFGNVGSLNSNFWDPMKEGVLKVVQELESEVRFGFASYTGTQGTCDGLESPTAIAYDNFSVIQSAYDALGHPGEKSETPTAAAIQEATAILEADPVAGEKYILLVSDGEPDFCNDNTPFCAVDATVAALQLAKAAGVTTLVFGIDNDGIQNPEYFDYFAQAGVGETPNWDKGLDVTAYNGTLHGQCEQSPEAELWRTLREATGQSPPADSCGQANLPPEGNTACFMPAGSYAATGGTATAFLNPDPAVLAEEILTQVQDLKSCTIEVNFEVLDSVDENGVASKDQGEIYVGDLENPIPKTDWDMPTPSSIQLLGASCDLWLLESTKDFFAGFPCSVIEEKPIIR